MKERPILFSSEMVKAILETRVINLLHDNHILHNSHSWAIYNGCKWMLDDLELTPDEWHDACKIIADYLGV